MSTVLNIRMKDETLRQTERLQESFHAPSKSDVIRRAIELSDAITTSIKSGGLVIIENKDGSRSRVILPGLTA
jgi:hypothetical protein